VQKDNRYIDIKFYRLWKYIRISRQKKEAAKSFLFSSAPFLFEKFASYQHWKHSRIFTGKANGMPPYTINDSPDIETGVSKSYKLAVVLHVFYVDVFLEILPLLFTGKTAGFKLFVTCPDELRAGVETGLKEYDVPFEIMTLKNRGRDILPFLKILPLVFEENFNLVLKLHTKRSNHLNKKDLWSADLFNKLTGSKSMERILSVFAARPEVGMVGPVGHILPMSLYYGGNAARVESLCLRMGLQQGQLGGLNFVAGSMFYARKKVLLPILQLNLTDSDFETENNQLDTTLAHAVERAFAGGLILTGLKLVDSSGSPVKISCRITKNHPFTI
jgi:lipopolysaccharide biosynthesis protein